MIASQSSISALSSRLPPASIHARTASGNVLAGWAAGLAWALGCWLVARYLQYRGAVEQPGRSSPR